MWSRRRGVALVAAVGVAWWAWRHASSPTVGAWSPPGGERRRVGGLAVRALGDGDPATVLLHGMMSSGDVFGGRYDERGAGGRLVVPDLLGFGRSLHGGDRFGLADHLDALDAMADGLGIAEAPLRVGGHSMGGILALHWAARHASRVERVVTWSAPLHETRPAALAAVDRMGALERLFVLDTPLSRAVCAWSCNHRELVGWLSAATNPDVPVSLARQGSRHTWPAYRGALEELVLASDWQPALDTLDAHGVPVVIALGVHDAVTDPALAARLATGRANVETRTHPTAGHELPLSDPAWCARQIAGAPVSA